MAQQHTLEFHKSAAHSRNKNDSEEPLQLHEMLSLIQAAHDHGYTVKDARDMKSLYDVISSDLYSVWYAIENQLPIFAHNILDLIEFTGWQRPQSSASDDEKGHGIAVA